MQNLAINMLSWPEQAEDKANPIAFYAKYGVLYRDSTSDDSMNNSQDSSFDDKSLVTRARQGDVSAFKQIYDLYHNNVAASIYRITRNSHDTEELLQDTFVTAYRKLDKFREEGSFEGWLKRIAVNNALGMLRRKKKISIVDPDLIASNRESLSSSTPAPSTSLERQEFDTAFREALLKLPQEFREPFCLAVLEKKSYTEIADDLEISLSLVKIRVYRARKQLKELLSSYSDNSNGRTS